MRSIQDAVKVITDHFFTNGFHQTAERLVLVDSNGKDLGGWSRQDRRSFLKLLGVSTAVAVAPKFIFDMAANSRIYTFAEKIEMIRVKPLHRSLKAQYMIVSSNVYDMMNAQALQNDLFISNLTDQINQDIIKNLRGF